MTVPEAGGGAAGSWDPPAQRVTPVLHTSPVASPAEAAAIVAAMEVLWPRPVMVAPERPPERHGAWRFSGRWWARPSTVRRVRPWH